MPALILRDTSNNVIVDTAYINYGLLSSGYLAYSNTVNGKVMKAINNDPTLASSWQDSPTYLDDLYYFTVTNAVAPIVFLAGQGFGEGITVSGSTYTFMFSGASTSTRIYVFDRMRDGGTGPVLRVRNTSNVVTFNSRMIPLNIRGAIVAPAVPTTNAPETNPKGPLTTYVGGTTIVNTTASGGSKHAMSYIDIATSLSDIAVNITFTRITRYWPGSSSVSAALFPHACSEYAFGNGSYVRFAFKSPAQAYLNNFTTSGVAYDQFANTPSDFYPTANYVTTANLPIPFTLS